MSSAPPDPNLDSPPPQPPLTSADQDDVKSLQTPLIVSLGAASLAIASAFMIMIGIQLTISASRFSDFALMLMVSYYLVGAFGFINAIFLAKGKFISSILGLIATFAMLGLFWTPSLLGFFALSMLGCAGFAGISVLLVGVSIPLTRTLEGNRKKFMESI